MVFQKLQDIISQKIIEKHMVYFRVPVYYIIMSLIEEVKILLQEKLPKIYH